MDLAELLALARVRHGMVQRAARQADHLRADGDAPFVQRLDGDLVALAHGADHVLLRHAAVVQNQLAGGRSANAQLVFFLAHLESRKLALDQKRRDAAVSGIRIGVGEQQEQSRFGGVGDPQLAAGEQKMVARIHRARGQRERVRSRSGFGKRVRSHRVGGQPRQILLLLRGIGPPQNRVVHDGILHVRDHAGRRDPRRTIPPPPECIGRNCRR